MPTVSYTGQSLSLEGRRIWIVGAGLQYARIPPEEWRQRIADARQAGFNTIETACPWSEHEVRRGRYRFDGPADVGAFLDLCAEADMHVIVRIGPFIGEGFDGGGLPAWLREEPDVVLREANEAYLQRVTRYFRKLLAEIAPRQVTKDGPVLLAQVEHEWLCANPEVAAAYLGEITRVTRECGITVPLVNANALWVDRGDTIDTWRGHGDLLANARQLRAVQPDAPRIVYAFTEAGRTAWGRPPRAVGNGRDLLRGCAEVLAAGAQPVVSPFHGGTNFGFLGGSFVGLDGGSATTSAACGAPLGEAGARGERYAMLRRVATFANAFGHVFSDLDADDQPVAIDLESIPGSGWSIVPQRGAGGRVIFAFGGARAKPSTLMLDTGERLDFDPGDQGVGWYVFDADLEGRGRLDYTNLMPFTIAGRLVVLQGPARMEAVISINGSPLHVTVPAGKQPLVVEHKGLWCVVCNQKQIDVTYAHGDEVWVGVSGFDADGTPRSAGSWSKATVVGEAGSTRVVALGTARAATRRRGGSVEWSAAPCAPQAEGTSPRYASIARPQSLAESGAMVGYGWYRGTCRTTSAKARLVAAPEAGLRMQLFADGAFVEVIGDGPGAAPGPIELKLAKGDHRIVVLADNVGRPAEGNDVGRRVGLYGGLWEVKARRAIKPKRVSAEPVDPFAVRGFIVGATTGWHSAEQQLEWSFTHQRKAPILVVVNGAEVSGTFVLNGVPIEHYAGPTGVGRARYLLSADRYESFKRGANVLRFAPDAHDDSHAKAMAEATAIYECESLLVPDDQWAFAKWEPPAPGAFEPVAAAKAGRFKGAPCWWSAAIACDPAAGPWWFDTTGLSKGAVFVNGRAVGRYFTATRTGKAVGPQVRLRVPESWLEADGPNRVHVFDEHGFAPTKTKLVARAEGDLD